MLPILQIGGFALQTAGLVMIATIWIGLSASERFSKRFGVDPNDIYNLVFYAMIGGVIGARLGYVIRFPSAFIASPASLISINPGLLDPVIGLLIAVLTSVYFGQRKGLPLLPVLDAIVPFLAVILIGLPVANLATGRAYGMASDLPWAVDLWSQSRHPSQIYEALAAGVLLAIYWPARQAASDSPGRYFLSWVIASALTRLFLEAFRADSVLLVGSIRQAQVFAWLIAAAGFYMLWRIRPIAVGHQAPPEAHVKPAASKTRSTKNKKRKKTN
jgi:phosphatidylglycerol:prolipoprotein diacylglycerol transferase